MRKPGRAMTECLMFASWVRNHVIIGGVLCAASTETFNGVLVRTEPQPLGANKETSTFGQAFQELRGKI